jgi:GntR family transcriptional repressor for pyruvate dehydrogenase complex
MTSMRGGDLVAQTIRRRILDGEFEQGQDLPPEWALIAEFGVSRPTLREAMRILETEGLIKVRRGRSGGAEVLQPSADRAAYHFGLVLQRQGTTMADIARARGVLTPACAGLCAGRPDHRQLAGDLSELVDRCDALVDGPEDWTGFPAAGLAVHNAILAACENTTLRLLMDALSSVWALQEQRMLEAIREVVGYPPREQRVELVRMLRGVVEHIDAGDVDGAERSMRDLGHVARGYWIDDDASDGAGLAERLRRQDIPA